MKEYFVALTIVTVAMIFQGWRLAGLPYRPVPPPEPVAIEVPTPTPSDECVCPDEPEPQFPEPFADEPEKS